jgi:hypothetical protein
MNEMKPVDPRPRVPPHDFFKAANEGLEHLKCFLANTLFYEEAFRVSEMLRDLDRTRLQYDHRNDIL